MTQGNELETAATRRFARVPATRRDEVAILARPGAPALARTPRPSVRWSRRRGVMGVFAAVAAVGFAGAYLAPAGAALAEAAPDPAGTTSYVLAANAVQSIQVESETESADFERDGYEVYVKPKPAPVVVAAAPDSPSTGWAPPAVTPDPGSAQAIAYEMVKARGWGDEEFNCLVALWNKESGWRVNAYNASSGAYGIPQSLPGNKMASAGADWETNPATQISWGLGYIQGRYGSPCGAWGHSQSVGWY